PSSPVERLVLRRLEPDDEALAELDYRSLDERGLRQHERQGLFPVEAFLLLRRELAKGRSRAVQKRFPSEPIAPRGESRTIDAGHLVVVKRVAHPCRVEPGARLLHGIAVADTVHRRYSHSMVAGGLEEMS